MLAWAIALSVVLGAAGGWAVNRAVAPVGTSASSSTLFQEIAGVFDEQLAGFQMSYTPEFADRLTAVRPAALKSVGWPEADYALFHVPKAYESNPKAAGLVVWAGNEEGGTGWATLCAEVRADRSGARIHLQEMRCPKDVPSETQQADAPHESAVMLDVSAEIRGDLAVGQPAKRGMTMSGIFPANPEPATGPCPANGLNATVDSGNAAGSTDDYIVRVQNVSAKPCALSEATGIVINRGTETLRPPWTQQGSTVTLQPWESASMAISYSPADISSGHQIITLNFPGGEVSVGTHTGPAGTMLAVSKSTQVSAAPWEVVGFGLGVGTWENGYVQADIAPTCQAQQIAVTTPRWKEHSSGQDKPVELPYRLLNISTGTCRIDAGTFAGIDAVPPLNIASTVVLQPGTALDVDIDGGAPNLTGLLVVDGVQISTVVQ